jgi:peptide/nickel transport system ATP-binding protein
VTFPTPAGKVLAVRGVNLDVARGEVVGIVGESGSGKSVSFLSILGLLPPSAIISGSATLDGTELIGADMKTIRSVRGKRMSMIFQDPLSALNPVHRIGDQIVEMILAHQSLTKQQAHDRDGHSKRTGRADCR